MLAPILQAREEMHRTYLGKDDFMNEFIHAIHQALEQTKEKKECYEITPDLSSSPFHCYNCVARKSKARYPMNLDLRTRNKKSGTLEKQHERIEAKYLIFHRN